MFESVRFIRSSAVNDGSGKTWAPMFRRKFVIEKPFASATLAVCALGYGYCFLNGRRVTEDLFTAPVGDYRKTLWYNEYDVTDLLCVGENVLSAVCGNGWYNEIIPSSWDTDKSEWNDTPKIILQLTVDGETVLSSDEQFRVTLDTPYSYNQLRSGEHFDARKYDADWNTLSYDDSAWEFARFDDRAPHGEFRKCLCEPIRALCEYPAVSVTKTGEDTYVYDFGQNMSGFVRVETDLPAGTELVIRYAELMNEDGTRNINKMERFFKESEIETDRLICSGSHLVWSPCFTYHGFQYAVISGIGDKSKITVTGIFVHQDVAQRAEFECSDPVLTKLYRMGKISSWSNMFYQMTDCPTREKLGWLNDARASAGQLLTNFKTEKFFAKWIVDIRDAMREDGMMPGIAPTWGWGYDWGNGPVSDGCLFEVPYQVYVQTGCSALLTESIPWFDRYLSYLDTRRDENGLIDFGLPDWAAPGQKTELPRTFTNAVLEYWFLHIAVLAKRLAGQDGKALSQKKSRQAERIKRLYLKSGRCVYDEQTAVAMLIYYGLYDDLAPLRSQLAGLIEREGFHHHCGMVGLRHLYDALTKCGLSDYAFRVITNPTYPAPGYWVALGANTLWEMWEPQMSRNHHMYSAFMGWLIDAVLGIRADEAHPGYAEVRLAPSFIGSLTFAKGYVDTVSGKLEVGWMRAGDTVCLSVTVPAGMAVYHDGKRLNEGENEIIIKENRR